MPPFDAALYKSIDEAVSAGLVATCDDDAYFLDCPWPVNNGAYDPAAEWETLTASTDTTVSCRFPRVPKEFPNKRPENDPITSERK